MHIALLIIIIIPIPIKIVEFYNKKTKKDIHVVRVDTRYR